MAPTLVPSTDGVRVAVHDLGGPGDPAAPVIVFSHATGLHGRVWAPMAEQLADRFRCLAVDYRGHGMAETPAGCTFAWPGFGDDAVAVLDSGLIADGTAVHGAGHSMGGAALVMASARRPEALRSLWLFEPIVAPPTSFLAGGDNPLADGALRRRPTFPSLQAALDNYRSKPPLDVLHPDALLAYVGGGFGPEPDGTVTLRCRPEVEAATFRAAGTSGAWELLPDLKVPVTVVKGEEETWGPAEFAEDIARALPDGRVASHPELGHFGPLEAPEAMAAELAAWIDSVG